MGARSSPTKRTTSSDGNKSILLLLVALVTPCKALMHVVTPRASPSGFRVLNVAASLSIAIPQWAPDPRLGTHPIRPLTGAGAPNPGLGTPPDQFRTQQTARLLSRSTGSPFSESTFSARRPVPVEGYSLHFQLKPPGPGPSLDQSSDDRLRFSPPPPSSTSSTPASQPAREHVYATLQQKRSCTLGEISINPAARRTTIILVASFREPERQCRWR